MSTYIKNFLKFQPLLSELVARDVKIKYRRSVLGVLWTLLNPLCMMVILSVVFSNIFKFDVENFPLYVLSGQVIFNFFNDATTSSMTSIISNALVLSAIPLLLVVAFSLGVGMLLAALTVRFRDIMHLYSVFTTGLMYLTPVIYPMSMLPSGIKSVVLLNPLTNYVTMFRDLAFNSTIPSFGSMILGIVECLAAIVLGVYVFYKNQDEFILNI